MDGPIMNIIQMIIEYDSDDYNSEINFNRKKYNIARRALRPYRKCKTKMEHTKTKHTPEQKYSKGSRF